MFPNKSRDQCPCHEDTLVNNYVIRLKIMRFCVFHSSSGWIFLDNVTHPQNLTSSVHVTLNIAKGVKPFKFVHCSDTMDSVLYVTLLFFILLLGSVGNIVVVATIARNTTFNRAPFFFLLNLSISDLCRCLFCVPFVIASVIQDVGWIHGEVSCTAIAFTNFFFVFNSFITLMIIAIDRYISVSYPYIHKRWLHGPTSLVLVAIGWLLSALVSLPPVFGNGSYTFVEEEHQCTFQHTSYKHNDTFGFLLVLTAVQFGSFFIYGRIFIFLRDHRRMKPLENPPAMSSNWTMAGPGLRNVFPIAWTGVPLHPIPTITQNLSNASGQINHIRERKNEHLTRLFFALTLCVYLLWSLYSVQSFILIFSDVTIPITMRRVTTVTTFLQVCVSPVTFIFHFRKILTNNVRSFRRRRKFFC